MEENLIEINLNEINLNEIEDELTDEQKELLELDIRKEKYKKLQQYLQSEAFIELCEYFEGEWNSVEKEVQFERQNRLETKSTKSQVDKDEIFQDILIEFKYKLWNTDWEEVLKEYFQDQIDAIETNILNKISYEDALYDIPFYTVLDLLKQTRMDYLTFEKRIKSITASFADKKEEIANANPYV